MLVNDLGIEPTSLSQTGFHLVKGPKKIMITTATKSKVEFRFARSKKEEIEKLLADLNLSRLIVKDKADIEAHGLANPTPSIDYKGDVVSLGDIEKVCREWLNSS